MVRSVRECDECGKRFVPDQFQYASFDAPLENPVSYEWIPWTDQELAQWDTLDDKMKMQWKRKSRNLTRGARRRGYAGSVAGRDLWLLNNRYQGHCAYCGQPGADSWDHVKPLALGGEHTPSNILPAHLMCNRELGYWDDRNRDYVSPTMEQMNPQWTMQPAEAKTARLKGFRVWSADIAALADRNRQQARQQFSEYFANDKVGQRNYNLAIQLITAIPDQGYKLIPWAAREIMKRDLFNLQNWGHARDIITQAARWFDWAREHNKPLPEFNRKDFGFHELENWVYEMNSQNNEEGSDWTDSTPVYTWEDGWHLDKVGPSDLAREGELMGHCVGGYCDAVTSGNTSIFSLRDPKGQPHVTLEIEGDFDGTSSPKELNQEGAPEWQRLNVIQVQGKQDTEPIPEYREYIDDWFQTLRLKHWDVEEQDPDREPETEYIDHPEGALSLDEPEDYLKYHEIMTNHYDRQYHFEDDEDPEFDNNTFYYTSPRTLDTPATPRAFASHAYDFIKGWEAGQYTKEDALRFVQAMWMSLHHSASDGQRYRTQMWPRQDANGQYLYGDQLHKVVQNFWANIHDYLEEIEETANPPKPTPGDTLFNPSQYVSDYDVITG
jgi:hypothetical protein